MPCRPLLYCNLIALFVPGTFITLLTPLLPSLGTFTPILVGVALPDVNLAKNLPNQTLDASLIYNQVGWHRAGLADGPHTFEMRNVGGQVKGTGGQMMEIGRASCRERV